MLHIAKIHVNIKIVGTYVRAQVGTNGRLDGGTTVRIDDRTHFVTHVRSAAGRYGTTHVNMCK